MVETAATVHAAYPERTNDPPTVMPRRGIRFADGGGARRGRRAEAPPTGAISKSPVRSHLHRDESKEHERVRVGPVEIVEDTDRRSSAMRAAAPTDRAHGSGLGGSRTSAVRGQSHVRASSAADAHVHRAAPRSVRSVARRRARPGAEHLHPRQVGGAPLLGAPAPKDAVSGRHSRAIALGGRVLPMPA